MEDSRLILYSPAEVAKILGIQRRAVYTLINNKSLTAAKVTDGTWRIAKIDLIDYIEKHKTRGGEKNDTRRT